MTNEINDVKARARAEGGFFDQVGNLRERQRAAPEATPPADDSSQVSAEKSVGNALQRTRSDVAEQVNGVVSQLNINKAELKEARDINADQRDALRDLRAALKDGNEVAADQARAAFTQLEGQRGVLAVRVDEQNREQDESRVFAIRVGNKEQGRGEVPEVKVVSSLKADLSSRKGIDKALDDLAVERESIDSQLRAQRDTTKQVRELASQSREELKRIEADAARQEERALEGLERAQRLANEVAGAIQSGANGLVNRLSQNNVQRLLQI